ncbi:MAG: ion transporter [Alphaproteobacteria bacterium]|nr:ion transporter [Alphaproteobacteria bacterium]
MNELYNGDTRRAHWFGYAMMVFDAGMIAFIVGSSFAAGGWFIEFGDVVLGVVVAADVTARLVVSRNRWREMLHPTGVADLIVIVSLLAPVIGQNLAFLRVARTLRLFRSYRLVARLRRDLPFFRRHQDLIQAAVNLLVFMFVMTAIVYETQHHHNPQIGNYIDALYFTVTTLTTTGFGDVILSGPGDRLLSVLIMIFGVSLFIRLIQLMFRPPKLHWRCPECGLVRHEPDALHCKHCGAALNVPHGDLA